MLLNKDQSHIDLQVLLLSEPVTVTVTIGGSANSSLNKAVNELTFTLIPLTPVGL